jgi:hypothetical protein
MDKKNFTAILEYNRLHNSYRDDLDRYGREYLGQQLNEVSYKIKMKNARVNFNQRLLDWFLKLSQEDQFLLIDMSLTDTSIWNYLKPLLVDHPVISYRELIS